VIGTFVAVLAVCGATLAIGQAAIALCGGRRWSWLSPAVGLALLCAFCWGTVRLPGDGAISAAVVFALTAAAVLCLRGRVEAGREALRAGIPVALAALAAASLPFAVEGHFGILGTSFNPDMSQHLLAAERLSHGDGSQLLHQGYPLGPHAIAVALNKGLGIGLVQGFDGLTVAVTVLASLTALAAFAELPPLRRTTAALLVGIPYLVASYYAQGAPKETMQALFVLAFALALREASRNPAWRTLPLRLVPAALIAVGSVYTYSFPGLIWLIATAAIWAMVEYAATPTTGPAGLRAMVLALLVFLVLVAPEIGRMIDFHAFETFDPNGPGLGNLFGQVSPLEALGIWPSGDFRLAPGDGAAPAAAYYLGAVFALALLLYGLARCWRRRETAVLAGLLAAVGVYLAARAGGTPYTAAKAIEVAAPLVTLIILLPLSWRVDLSASSAGGAAGGTASEEASATAGGGGSPAATGPAGLAFLAYLLAAGACSLLALANAPVGPTAYTPALAELRPLVNSAPTVILASHELLSDQHGTPYLAWELRGGRVCIEPAGEAGGDPPPGVRFVISEGSATRPPFRGLRLRRRADPYVLWERTGPIRGRSPCPLIAVRQARQGPVRRG
jgi:hypothetical protein